MASGGFLHTQSLSPFFYSLDQAVQLKQWLLTVLSEYHTDCSITIRVFRSFTNSSS